MPPALWSTVCAGHVGAALHTRHLLGSASIPHELGVDNGQWLVWVPDSHEAHALALLVQNPPPPDPMAHRDACSWCEGAGWWRFPRELLRCAACSGSGHRAPRL